MKKAILLITTAFLAFSSFAGGNEAKSLKKLGEGVLSKGFYLNLGLGFPVYSGTIYLNSPSNYSNSALSLGLQGSLEIGNQWYFWHNKRLGVGLKASWLQLGYSSPSSNYYYSTGYSNQSNNDLDIHILKIAPQFSVAITNDIAIDLSFEASPTLNMNIVYFKDAFALDNVYTNYNYGALFSPGIRFRYKIFAAGFDYTVAGIMYNKQTYTHDNNKKFDINGTSTFVQPRIYLGFQF